MWAVALNRLGETRRTTGEARFGELSGVQKGSVRPGKSLRARQFCYAEG